MYEQFKPPTDNLYKFIAIFGLMMLFMAAWLYKSHIDNVAQFNVEAIDIHLLAQREAAEEQAAAQADTPDDQYDEVLEADLRIQPRKEAIVAQTKTLGMVIGWLIVVGVILTVLGFLAWYFLVQKVEDQVRVAQLELMTGQRCDKCKRLVPQPKG